MLVKSDNFSAEIEEWKRWQILAIDFENTRKKLESFSSSISSFNPQIMPNKYFSMIKKLSVSFFSGVTASFCYGDPAVISSHQPPLAGPKRSQLAPSQSYHPFSTHYSPRWVLTAGCPRSVQSSTRITFPHAESWRSSASFARTTFASTSWFTSCSRRVSACPVRRWCFSATAPNGGPSSAACIIRSAWRWWFSPRSVSSSWQSTIIYQEFDNFLAQSK